MVKAYVVYYEVWDDGRIMEIREVILSTNEERVKEKVAELNKGVFLGYKYVEVPFKAIP